MWLCEVLNLNVFPHFVRYTSPTDLMMSPVTKGLFAKTRRDGGAVLPPGGKNRPKVNQWGNNILFCIHFFYLCYFTLFWYLAICTVLVYVCHFQLLQILDMPLKDVGPIQNKLPMLIDEKINSAWRIQRTFVQHDNSFDSGSKGV